MGWATRQEKQLLQKNATNIRCSSAKVLPPASEPPPVKSTPGPRALRAETLSPLTMILGGARHGWSIAQDLKKKKYQLSGSETEKTQRHEFSS